MNNPSEPTNYEDTPASAEKRLYTEGLYTGEGLYTDEGLYTSERLYTSEGLYADNEVDDYKEAGNYEEVDDYKKVGDYREVGDYVLELSLEEEAEIFKQIKKRKGKATVMAAVSCSQLRRQPSDFFRNCELKAVLGTKNVFDLIYSQKQKKIRISEHYDKTNSSYSVGSEPRKANIPDASVGQSCDVITRKRVIKASDPYFIALLGNVCLCKGYLDITTTWINEKFELNEAVLAVTSLQYLYTDDAIVKYIKDILEY
ncbi:9265_t:CDS:2 [Cetraspora pellucida]|uniref:9265_t:CDS:1 n=1 Tax=Cetraspora pellucida TaxID=1433469 RepID=A0A9N9HBF4_9GLOM|nr:9265_t:CDS:2 [Cetraspora pellucida]